MLKLNVPISSISNQSVVCLKDSVWFPRFGLAVLKVHVVCARGFDRGSSADLCHGSGSSGIGVDVRALNESLLVGGATCQRLLSMG